MSSQLPQRLTSRQSAAQSQRRAMTERRQRLSQQIRKKKKTDWLAQKRGLANSTAGAPPASSTADLSQALNHFLQLVPPTVDSLQQLRKTLQLSSLSALPWTLEDPARLELAQKVVQRLDATMDHFLSNNDLGMALATAQVLVQLVALSSSAAENRKQDAGVYYGRQTFTWCDLILEQSKIESKIPQILSSIPQQSSTPASDLTLQVVEQTCWFLGNLAQEMPSACTRLRQEGNFMVLLTNVLSLIHNNQNQQSEWSGKTIGVIQAAAWAFSNLLKGDMTSSGWEYCQTKDHVGMHPELASGLLSLSVPVIQASQQLQTGCIDISVQAAWILVHLSQREDEVVNFLLEQTPTVDLIRNVMERLYQVCEGAQQQKSGTNNPTTTNPLSPGRPNYFHHPLLEPCLEVLGHWSSGSNGRHVPRLLATTPPTSCVQQELSLLPLLETLIQWGQQGLLMQTDYLQVLWLSGCLLCDAGLPNHPSTKLAATTLLPLLTRGLVDSPNNSRANSLECKREGVLALWNAVSAPPTEVDEEPVLMLATKKFMLRRVLSACSSGDGSTDGEDLDSESVYTVLMALKNILQCQDVDAMLASMHVLNAILRLIPDSRITFMEVNGDEALEMICDLPLGNDQSGAEAADMAANLIDDFFDIDGMNDDQFSDLQPPQLGDTFVFGLDPEMQESTFDFDSIFLPSDSMLTNDAGSASGSFPAIAPVTSVGEPMASGNGRGRGRGRGHVLPAWAQQQQHQSQS